MRKTILKMRKTCAKLADSALKRCGQVSTHRPLGITPATTERAKVPIYTRFSLPFCSPISTAIFRQITSVTTPVFRTFPTTYYYYNKVNI